MTMTMTMTMKRQLLLLLSFLVITIAQTSAFNVNFSERRDFIQGIIASTAVVGGCLLGPDDAYATRAVGGAEEDCRAAGNCLQKGELDGALGWSWGAKDRCDASDPRCGADGRDVNTAKLPVPSKPGGLEITDVAEISLAIGRNEEATIRIGLFGNDAEAAVAEFLRFVSPRGLKTTSEIVFQNGIGVQTQPVSLDRGGILVQVVPGQTITFGVPLQSAAYARSKGLAKAGDDFVPQPKPKPLVDIPVLRKHDASGLVSIGAKGLGYGGTGFESDDECYESAFSITATGVPSMDKDRRVIGQLMDDESMAALARLANLATKKGFKGFIPGQTSGPPLLRVTVSGVEIQSKNKTAAPAVAAL